MPSALGNFRGKRLTQREADSRFHHAGLTMLEPYVNKDTRVLSRCTICEHEWMPFPGNIFNGQGCPKCSDCAPLTQEEASIRFRNNGITMLGKYISSTKKVCARCIKCGHVWNPTANNVFRGTGCPKCAGKMRLTQEEAESRFNAIGIQMLEPYVNYDTNILVLGVKCGHKWMCHPGYIFQGHGCPKCGGTLKLTQDEAFKRCKDMGIEMLEPYINSITKIILGCLKCGHKWIGYPEGIFRGHGCHKCGGTMRLTQHEVNYRLISRSIEILEPYTNCNAAHLMKCKTCGHEWKAKPDNIFQGTGCPKCAERGFNPGNPAILYYLRVSNPYGDPLYKIGITNHTVQKRFRGEMGQIEILNIEHFSVGSDAYAKEQRILRQYEQYAYTGPAILRNNGNNELFTVDVLSLENSQSHALEQLEFPFTSCSLTRPELKQGFAIDTILSE